MHWFNEILTTWNVYLYSYILIFLLLLTGLYFSIRSGLIQFRLLPDALRAIREPKHGKVGISSFQALMISTASRVGTGNIAGVATAIAAGGPGAVFWMWLTAIFGSASAFIESTLAQIFKVRDGDYFRGGPSYYIQQGLGKRWLGIVFSCLLISCFAYGFNGLQAYNAVSVFQYYFGGQFSGYWFQLTMGLFLASATALVIFGGAHRIGFITSYVVPVMASAYLLLGLWIILINFERVPAVFSEIFAAAFDWQSIFGGFSGSAVAYGIKRGLFSNEAGMGSAPNAAATADVHHPVQQGLVQVISVFIDTLLICTTTALMLLLSNIDGSSALNGMPFVQKAIASQIGTTGIHFITFSVVLFAFSSMIGNYYYAEANFLFISTHPYLLFLFRCTAVLMVFCGALASFDFVWNLADVLMGCMALLNILVILRLGPLALAALHDYQAQKQAHQEPIFLAAHIGLFHTEMWRAEDPDKNKKSC